MADLGLNGYGVRTIAAATAGPAKKDILVGISRLYVTSASVVAVVGTTFAALTVANPWVFAACFLYLPCYAAFPDWYLRGAGQLSRLALMNWLATLGPVLSLVLAAQGLSVTLVAAAWGLGPAIPAIAFWITEPHEGMRSAELESVAWRSHLRVSIRFALSGWLSSFSMPLAIAMSATRMTPDGAAAYVLGLRVAAAASGVLWQLLQNSLHLLVSGLGTLNLRRFVLTGWGLAATLSIIGWASWPIVSRISAVEGDVQLYLFGVALLLPWGIKMPGEALLIAAYLDWPRVYVGVAAIVALVALVVGLNRPVPAAYLAAETCAAIVAIGLAWAAIARPRQVGHRNR
jgi:hypothetical protein